MNTEALLGVIPQAGAVVAIVISISTYFLSRRSQIQLEQENALDAWQDLLTPLRERVAELEALSTNQRNRIRALEATEKENEARLRAMENELTRFVNGTNLLINQIRAHGNTPVWIPTRLKDAQ